MYCKYDLAKNSSKVTSLDSQVLGKSAMACCVWGEHLVIASGRGGESNCHVMALRFMYAADDESTFIRGIPAWKFFRWSILGETGDTGRVGCGLVIIHDKLYISGGVDEGSNGGFDATTARWNGKYSDLPTREKPESEHPGWDEDVYSFNVKKGWHKVDGLDLPIAMHAHHAISIPWLPTSTAPDRPEMVS